MKLLVLGVVMACQFTTFLPQAMCQDRNTAEQMLHLQRATPQGASVNMAALSIERPAPTLTWQPSVIQLKGNVEIRTCCMRAPAWKGNAPRQYMVLRADEAEYHEDTGEIEARGNVRVKPEPAK